MYDMKYIKKIYNHIQDEQSRQIYMARFNYSMTEDSLFLYDMVDKTIRNKTAWKQFVLFLQEIDKNNEVVIFGAGIWGDILYSETCQYIEWEAVVDSKPSDKMIGNLPVIGFDEFVQNYQNEYVVISSYKNFNEMREQLQKYHIPKERIINAGTVIYGLTEGAIYFDLDVIKPDKSGEVFVDAGSFDGLTAKQFFKWCDGKGTAYCLEPDMHNIALIMNNLSGYKNYKIIDKALWSKNSILSIDEKKNFATSVGEWDGDSKTKTIDAVTLDSCIDEKKITFIKMDIEGAELDALKGACQVIKRQHPKLAISVYHKLEDIWTIPGLILEYHPEYKLYLRHYSFSDYDTVLYAIP